MTEDERKLRGSAGRPRNPRRRFSEGHHDAKPMRRAMRLSVVDAALYAFMVGLSEVYFLADAIRLGASPVELALIVSLPLCAGAAGPLIALRSLARLGSRRPFVVGAALCQAATLVLLAATDALHVSSPVTLLGIICLYQICGQAAGTAWSSWFGDLVPRRIRGRYFARRNRSAYAATTLGLLTGGFVLHHMEPERAVDAAAALGSVGAVGGTGFAVLFASAALFRLVSASLLASSWEPRFRGLSSRVRVVRYLASARGTSAWRLIALVAVLQFTVYLGSPYFMPYLLEELRFTYLEYTLASMTVILSKIAFLPAWGRIVDQHGARPLCLLAVVMLAFVPLPWLWAGGLGWVAVAQAFSGLSWAGFELSVFTLLLETSYRSTRLHVFAALSVATGTAQLLGGLTGGLFLYGWLGVPALFAVSLVARLCVAAAFPHFLPKPKAGVHVRSRDLLLRVIGIRPSGGLVHRPVAAQLPLSAPSPEEESELGELEASA